MVYDFPVIVYGGEGGAITSVSFDQLAINNNNRNSCRYDMGVVTCGNLIILLDF